MCRTPGIVVIAPRIVPGLDRNEAVQSFFVRYCTAGSREVWVEGSVVRIHLMRVPAAGVRLPDFNQRSRNRSPVLVQHPALDDDPLADRRRSMLPRQVAVHLADRVVGI